MKLLIAEKPSVAASIAKVIGARKRQEGYFVGNGYLVSWCYGHILTPAEPAAYDPQYAKWDVSLLPILPETFQTVLSPKTVVQFYVLQELMERADVESLIEATDAGREGELIFRLVYEAAGCQKPFQRLWISSMEESAIRSGMANLQPSAAYDALYAAALCRQRADWLVGINATRLYTSLYRRKLTVGRGQTPTLHLIVRRWQARQDFVPEAYYRITADLGGWSVSRRENDRTAAIRLIDQCRAAAAIVTDVQRAEKRENPPALYDLTSLQRDANRLYGYTAKQTLDYAQSLYEHKLATYPRTDSRYLTRDMTHSASALLQHLLALESLAAIAAAYDASAADISQIVNDAKVSDHHAILPTRAVTDVRLQELPTGERSILLLLSFRLLAAVSAPHRYAATRATVTIGGVDFSAAGREELDAGFQLVVDAAKATLRENRTEKQPALPRLSIGQALSVVSTNMEEKQTQPPALYTEEALLSAMETAGREIDDPVLRESMKGRGLGTPATRAGIIENLVSTGYVRREKKALVPTEQALLLTNLVADALKEPELTAQWEEALSRIQRGEADPNAFMRRISAFTASIVEQGKATYSDDAARRLQAFPVIGTCPRCGRAVRAYEKSYSCESGKDGCGFVIWREISGESISGEQAAALLQHGATDLIRFTSKTGKSYRAFLVLREDHSVGFAFPKRKRRGK